MHVASKGSSQSADAVGIAAHCAEHWGLRHSAALLGTKQELDGFRKLCDTVSLTLRNRDKRLVGLLPCLGYDGIRTKPSALRTLKQNAPEHGWKSHPNPWEKTRSVTSRERETQDPKQRIRPFSTT